MNNDVPTENDSLLKRFRNLVLPEKPGDNILIRIGKGATAYVILILGACLAIATIAAASLAL
ncbi:hypothetical protein [uncultured Chitinophaga sp.]|uniref:hypothetical protein n=1 Tax=uncultured Chitinophaga sp. TaxID=339340 RepID=UPI0025D146A9|nr:hypothetical protein [uncultured Chitinophaga sp.]